MEIFRLSNGVRVAMEELPHLRSVSVGIWVGAGCFAEDEKNNGISHFIEHMLFKGTKNRSAKEIAGCIDALGGQLNAFTAKECTCYYVNILSEHYGVAVNPLTDMVLNSTFLAEDIKKEKGVVLEEINMVEDTPDEVCHDNLSKAYYGNHPLGKTILGTKETVQGISEADIRAYMAKTYVPENIVVSVAGNFNKDDVLTMLEEKLGAKLKGDGKPEKASPKDKPDCGIILVNKDIEQVNLCLALPGVSQQSDDYFAEGIIATVFGGGMSSRLFQRVREENGMTYSIYSYLASTVNSGMLSIYAGMNPKQAKTVLELILDEGEKLLENGITEKEFNEAKEQHKGGFVLGLESAVARMNRNGKVLLLNDKVLTMDEVISKINNVTMDDINRNIKRMFDFSILSASVVGKVSKNDEFYSRLTQI